MALAAGTDGAAGAMADAALEQGAAEDVGGGGEGGGELGEGLVCLFHLSVWNHKTEGRVKSFSNIFTRFCFFDLKARLPPHRVRPGRNDDARLSAVARQSEKSEGLAKTQRMPSPLDFFAFPAPWRDTIFPLWMIYPFSANPSLLSGKPGVTSFRKFSVQLPIGWLGALTSNAQFANQTGSRGQRAVRLARPTPRREAAPGASLQLIACLILDNRFLLIYQ